uniref:Uncharacterized protein n=1 Tax=Megaselia scalaris TaxID=36166 RepID=T1GHT2_MEGSC
MFTSCCKNKNGDLITKKEEVPMQWEDFFSELLNGNESRTSPQGNQSHKMVPQKWLAPDEGSFDFGQISSIRPKFVQTLLLDQQRGAEFISTAVASKKLLWTFAFLKIVKFK